MNGMEHGLVSVDFYGAPVVQGSKQELVKALGDMLDRGQRVQVTTMNAQIAYFHLYLEGFSGAIHRSLVIPDGIGLTWALKLLKKEKVQRFPGVELGMELCQLAAAKGQSVFLLGAREGVAEKAGDFLHAKTGVHIAGTFHGFFDGKGVSSDAICARIRQSGAQILLVGLGAPKQEFWLHDHLSQTGTLLGVGVGGSLDVYAGVMKRAPGWVQKANLEWAYRILQNPRKKCKVVFQILRFLWRVSKDRFFRQT